MNSQPTVESFQKEALDRHNFFRSKHGVPELNWCVEVSGFKDVLRITFRSCGFHCRTSKVGNNSHTTYSIFLSSVQQKLKSTLIILPRTSFATVRRGALGKICSTHVNRSYQVKRMIDIDYSLHRNSIETGIQFFLLRNLSYHFFFSQFPKLPGQWMTGMRKSKTWKGSVSLRSAILVKLVEDYNKRE